MTLVTPGINFIESFMMDTCIIERDNEHQYDDVVDPDTYEVLQPPGDREEIYQGICTIKPIGKKDLYYQQGAAPEFRKFYRVLLPISVTTVRVGDYFTILTSYNDSELEDVELYVAETEFGTHMTYRHLFVERISDIPGTQV